VQKSKNDAALGGGFALCCGFAAAPLRHIVVRRQQVDAVTKSPFTSLSLPAPAASGVSRQVLRCR
jgi:hypothetical protein